MTFERNICLPDLPAIISRYLVFFLVFFFFWVTLHQGDRYRQCRSSEQQSLQTTETAVARARASVPSPAPGPASSPRAAMCLPPASVCLAAVVKV